MQNHTVDQQARLEAPSWESLRIISPCAHSFQSIFYLGECVRSLLSVGHHFDIC
jgi:hypothetical protein